MQVLVLAALGWFIYGFWSWSSIKCLPDLHRLISWKSWWASIPHPRQTPYYPENDVIKLTHSWLLVGMTASAYENNLLCHVCFDWVAVKGSALNPPWLVLLYVRASTGEFLCQSGMYWLVTWLGYLWLPFQLFVRLVTSDPTLFLLCCILRVGIR